MDPQFQELASEIADAVEKRLSGAFAERIKTHIDTVEERVATNVETRLSGAFEQRIKTHVDTVEQRIKTNVEKHLSGAFEERIKTHIDQFEKRAETRMKMHFENLEGVVKGAAEGYGGNLDRIERELNALNKKFDTKFGDHDRVLDNHNERLVKLERPSETPI